MLERIQRYLVMAMGLVCLIVGIHWRSDIDFLVNHGETIIQHTAMGVMFTLTGVALRGMCEHLWHKLVLGAILITLESIFTVAVIG